MRKVFVTYSDQRLIAARFRIAREARATGEFDRIVACGPEDLTAEIRNCKAFQVPRGAGLWSWKPDIIFTVMSQLDDGDIVIYCDAGCSLFKGREWQRIWRKLGKCDLLAQLIFRKMECWTRRELLEEFGELNMGSLYQFMATVIIVAKSAFTMKFIAEWRRYMLERPELFEDVPQDRQGMQSKKFVESRYDQSVYSALVYRALADANDHSRVMVQWEHVEDLDLISSHVIRGTRWFEDRPYEYTAKTVFRSAARRMLKDWVYRPFIAAPWQFLAMRKLRHG